MPAGTLTQGDIETINMANKYLVDKGPDNLVTRVEAVEQTVSWADI